MIDCIVLLLRSADVHRLKFLQTVFFLSVSKKFSFCFFPMVEETKVIVFHFSNAVRLHIEHQAHESSRVVGSNLFVHFGFSCLFGGSEIRKL